MGLSRKEKETIILFNECDDIATIETYNSRIRRRLQSIQNQNSKCICLFEKDDYVKYEVPKNWIQVNPPKQSSDRQKEEMSERMKKRYAKNNDMNQA